MQAQSCADLFIGINKYINRSVKRISFIFQRGHHPVVLGEIREKPNALIWTSFQLPIDKAAAAV